MQIIHDSLLTSQNHTPFMWSSGVEPPFVIEDFLTNHLELSSAPKVTSVTTFFLCNKINDTVRPKETKQKQSITHITPNKTLSSVPHRKKA